MIDSCFYYDERGVYKNRYDAIAYSLNLSKLKFYFADHFFKEFPWKVEPTETLQELYKQRAEYLRETYDYLVVCLSGGIDSTNMLEAFAYNGIFVDEIMSVGSFSQDRDKDIDYNHNKEIYRCVYPLLDRLALKDTVFNQVDYTRFFDDPTKHLSIPNIDVWPALIGTHFSPHIWFWRDIRKHIKCRDASKKVAILVAFDKPYIVPLQGKNFGMVFIDVGCLSYGRMGLHELDGRSIVNFYSYPEVTAARITAKQGHVLKRRILELDRWPDDMRSFSEKIVYAGLRNPIPYQASKSSNMFFSVRDTFILDKQETKIAKLWKDGMRMVKQTNRLDEFNKPISTRVYEL